ncbi:phage distal tail protein [Streptomyces sp. NPDC002431]
MPQQQLGRIQWGPLTFGPGTPYMVTAIEGLDDMPDIRAEDVPRPDQHGDYTGPDYTGPRVIQLGLGLRGQDPDDLRALTLALRAATQPQRQPAPLQLLDQGTLVYGKVRKRSLPYDADYLWRLGTAALEIYCADPYLYGVEEQTATTTAYSPAAGRAYPLTYAGVQPGQNLVLNPSTEVDLGNTTTFGSGMTRTRVTTQQKTGVASLQHTHTGTTTAGSTYSIQPVTSGTVYVALYVKVPAGAGADRGLLHWMSGTTSLASIELWPLATPDAQGWSLVTGSYTLTAGQTCDGLGLSFRASGTWWADSVIADTAPLHGYGDGSTGSGWTWTGTPNASTSVRTLTGTGRVYGDAGASGRLTAINGGASPAYPILRIDGPVANPSIEQVTTGGAITLDATIQGGEYLVIDTRTRAVLLMGSSPRRQWVRAGSTWPLLQPGVNTIAYRGSALPGAPGQSSLLTVTWRDTSL